MFPSYTNVPDAYKPLLDLLGDKLMTSEEVSDLLRYSMQHLANLRRSGRATTLSWIKLPFGAIRYRSADVALALIGGWEGPLTLDRVNVAIAACPNVPTETKRLIQEHVRKSFLPVSST